MVSIFSQVFFTYVEIIICTFSNNNINYKYTTLKWEGGGIRTAGVTYNW